MIPNADLFTAIIESTDAAVISKDLEGTVLSWNPGATGILGWTAEEMIGQPIRRIIPADRRDEGDSIIARIHRGESVPRFETWRLHKDGRLIPVAILVSPVRDASGAIIGASKIARDMSAEIAMRDTLARTEARFHLLADNIAQLAWIAEADGEIHWYNKRWFDYTGTTLEEMRGWGWRGAHHPDHVERVVEHYSRCMATGETWEDTFPLRSAAGDYRWFLSRAVPLRNASGAVACWFGTNTDITEQRAAEHQITLLLREVQHRSKNMLAIVQSIARQTSKSGEDFVNRLERRIAGLSANQDLLVSGNWTPVPIHELVDAQMAFLEDRAAQIDRAGPNLRVQASAAEAIAMALHEMATNAEKYGALSVPDGRVEVRWDLVASGDEEVFRMTWCEYGGPPVQEPPTRGFGSRILEAVPASKLNATIATEFPVGGFRWELTCPAGYVRDAGNT